MNAAARGTAVRLLGHLRDELGRTNFAGRPVTLLEGVGAAAGVVALAAARGRRTDAMVLGAVAALGLVDDLVEERRRARGIPVAKGLRGHLGGLAHGTVSTGALKALGIPALALVGAALAPAPRRVLTDAVLAAGTANLANLLDLRPGRALKALALPALALSVVPAAAGVERSAAGRDLGLAVLGPLLVCLPIDLAERGMLGDAGANVLGAAVGTAVARRAPAPVRIGVLVAVVGLTLASERVSFSAVIERTGWLRAADRLGRRAGTA
ncbi:hypothetical protein ACT3TZ_03885 [Brachybacterium sp. AOP25-B2-12]|uniref:hypothetical protein n=1 Tax=Brachybacterium sp. AOP25-B2-12 TaxID=3457710 RepID=UPI004033CC24